MGNPQFAFGRQKQIQRRNKDIVNLYCESETIEEIAECHMIPVKQVKNVIRQWQRGGAPPPYPEQEEDLLALIEELIPQFYALIKHLSSVGGVLKRKRLQQKLGVS